MYGIYPRSCDFIIEVIHEHRGNDKPSKSYHEAKRRKKLKDGFAQELSHDNFFYPYLVTLRNASCGDKQTDGDIAVLRLCVDQDGAKKNYIFLQQMLPNGDNRGYFGGRSPRGGRGSSRSEGGRGQPGQGFGRGMPGPPIPPQMLEQVWLLTRLEPRSFLDDVQRSMVI